MLPLSLACSHCLSPALVSLSLFAAVALWETHAVGAIARESRRLPKNVCKNSSNKILKRWKYTLIIISCCWCRCLIKDMWCDRIPQVCVSVCTCVCVSLSVCAAGNLLRSGGLTETQAADVHRDVCMLLHVASTCLYVCTCVPHMRILVPNYNTCS